MIHNGSLYTSNSQITTVFKETKNYENNSKKT